MLPRDTARTTITIYNFLPSLGTLQRTVIRDCVWMQGSQIKRAKQGAALPDDVLIQIPFSYKYFSVQDGQEFNGTGWTVRAGPELEGSYIAKGECPFLAPEAMPPPIVSPEQPEPSPSPGNPGDSAGERNWFILTLEAAPVDTDDFVRTVVIPFEEQYKPQRPEEITENFYGSRNMWYLEVKC